MPVGSLRWLHECVHAALPRGRMLRFGSAAFRFGRHPQLPDCGVLGVKQAKALYHPCSDGRGRRVRDRRSWIAHMPSRDRRLRQRAPECFLSSLRVTPSKYGSNPLLVAIDKAKMDLPCEISSLLEGYAHSVMIADLQLLHGPEGCGCNLKGSRLEQTALMRHNRKSARLARLGLAKTPVTCDSSIALSV